MVKACLIGFEEILPILASLLVLLDVRLFA